MGPGLGDNESRGQAARVVVVDVTASVFRRFVGHPGAWQQGCWTEESALWWQLPTTNAMDLTGAALSLQAPDSVFPHW